MNPSPSHQELQDMLPAAALEILDPPDGQRVLDHVRGCEECTRLLGEYREVAATLPVVLPEQQLEPARSDALRTRLLNRIRGQPGSDIALHPNHDNSRALRSGPRPDKWMGWMGWAVAAGLAGLLLVHHSVHRPVAYGWLAAGVLTFLVIGLGVFVRRQQSRLAALQDRLAAGERGEREGRTPQETSSGART